MKACTFHQCLFKQELYDILGSRAEDADALEKLIHASIARCGSTELMQKILPLLTDEEMLSCLCHALSRSDGAGEP